MAQSSIPPPPPGFTIIGQGSTAPRASQMAQPVSPRVSRALEGDPLQIIRGIAPDARITSARRTPERQAQLIADWERSGRQGVRPATNSRHLRGNAFDLAPGPGESMAQLEQRVRASGQPFSEIINEGDHVHVGWDGPQVGALATLGVSAPAATATASPPPPPGFTIVDQPTAQEPIAVEIDQGVQNINGRAILNGEDKGPWEQYQATQVRRQGDREARLERLAEPEYQRAIADARRGSANVPDELRAFGQGQTLGFLDEINALAQGGLQGLENAGRQVAGQEIRYGADMAAQAARDSERDAQALYAAENPLQNFGLQLAGGLATPGLAGGGNYIAGAQGAERLARAGIVGAGYGAASGFGNATGDVGERLPETAVGGLVGFGTGAVGQGAVDRIGRATANTAPSAARRLSREGVDLTPGQMLASTPLVGNMIRGAEEGASSIPFLGSPIAGARQQSVETFNRAAINRALAPINARLPRGLDAGYDAVENAQQQLGRAYDEVLPRVSATPDQQYYDDLAAVTVRAAEEMPPPMVEQFGRILNGRVFRGLEDDTSEISGTRFKAIESELGALAREQRTAADPANRALGRVLDDTREIVRDLIARQNPEEAARIANINRGYANLVRVEQAAGSTASQATEGVFSPTQLGVATARGSGRSQNAREGALMQDLAVAGRNIIPSRVGDSGTATRGALTALLGGLPAGAVNPALGVPVIATSIAYSRPAQAALNAIYRATDRQGASTGLQQLARFAQRNPALAPYYQAAAEYVLSLGQTQSPTTQPAPQSAPVPTLVQ